MPSFAPKNFTASATLALTDAETLLTVSAAAGLTLTLPASSGSGAVYKIYIQTTVTSSNVIIQVANVTDVMAGVAWSASDDAANAAIAFETLAASDTITMNGTTKGGIRGDWIMLTDAVSGFWSVEGFLSGTGTEVTPFSAAV